MRRYIRDGRGAAAGGAMQRGVERWVGAGPLLALVHGAIAVALAAMLAGCGGGEESASAQEEPPAAASAAPNAAESATRRALRNPPPPAPIAPDGAAASAAHPHLATANAAMLDYGRVMSDPNSTPAEREAARERMIAASKAPASRNFIKQAPLDLPPDWAAVRRVERNAREAELLVQVGDVDNLGFGWPPEFDPFSGKSTPVHRFPYGPEADDPPGTDRIMVNSGYRGRSAPNIDGYTRETDRPDNLPQPLVIEFDPQAVPIKAAVLQLFVDDFQAPVMKTRFAVTLDGQPAPDVELTVNKLNQTGPIGKLVTIRLLPEYLGLLADGRLVIAVDDATTNVGDGFAFDFVRLLVNPKGFVYTGTVRGIVVDAATGAPIAGALVSAANVRQATTPESGRFELQEVPAGLVVVTGSHPAYVTGSEQSDLVASDAIEVELRLERAKNEDLGARLEQEGKVDLYGIYFDTDKAVLKAESEGTLQQVLGLLKAKPALRLGIGGHTDSQSSDAYNLDLSKRRAQAVLKWLTDRGIAPARLQATGHGESQPVADNATEAGRALNRRVEIRDLDK